MDEDAQLVRADGHSPTLSVARDWMPGLSNTAVRRLFQQQAVRMNGKVIANPLTTVSDAFSQLLDNKREGALRIGKQIFVRLQQNVS